MEVISGIQGLTRALPHPVVCIGNFDGVHLGHKRIIGLAREKAQQRGGTSVVYTFRPHPQVALRPEAQLQLLSTYEEKLRLLRECGVDVVIEEPFSREFSTISPEQFFNGVILRQLSAEAIVVGYDFAFGKERQGHLDTLESFCNQAGVELTVVPAQRIEGQIVSSSRIRQALVSGDLSQATLLLGRPFSYQGVVIRGEGRGRKLGFPTANLKLENKLALPYGVYATWAVRDGSRHLSVTNVGVRPTFGTPVGSSSSAEELPVLVETHLLDAQLDLYGTALEVQFIQWLREERKFPGVDALKTQIGQDIALARTLLKS